MKKKIFFLTAKRGGYDAMKPLLNLFEKQNKYLLKVIITDQHLQKKFGNTSKIVKKEFANVVSVNSRQSTDSNEDRNKSMGRILLGLSSILKKNKPDLFLIYGDRCESLMAAVSCLNFEIPIAHFQGGDVSGNIDEKLRHSITKLSDFHFVSNNLSFQRLIQMGEDKKNIFLVGDNHVDSLMKVKIVKYDKLKKKLNLKHSKKPVIFLMHPDKLSNQKNKKWSYEILNILSTINRDVVCIYPCTDIGYEGIISSINKFKKNKNFHIYPNLPYEDFINLMKYSIFLIGNSSSGIIESSYLSTKVINLGNRQNGRLFNNNVYQADFDIKKIKRLIVKLINSNKKVTLKKNIYGNGKAYLESYKIINKLLNQKTIKKDKIFKMLKK